MTDRFVAIGECMVEMAPRQDGAFSMGFAGDTLNTSWYARRCLPPAWDVEYFTAVGTDTVSDDMLAFIGRGGIGTDHVVRIPDRTVGLYLIQLKAGERSFAYWRSAAAARLLAADPEKLRAAISGAKMLYISGITLAILEPEHRAALLAALSAEQTRGATVVLDTNLRPRLWPDRATMCAAITGAAGVADIVLPSFDEESAAFGDASPEVTARRFAAAGAPLVVVKNGPDEMVALENGTLTRYAPRPASAIVDTTAAGDSFNAAFLAARLDGAPLEQAMAKGSELAARVIGHRGALVDA